MAIFVFNVINCRIAKTVRFKWLKSNFVESISGTDVNVSAVETRWILTLMLTPIVNDY